MPSKLATGQFLENAGADTSVSEGTQVSAAGSNNVKGSYVQLIASTAHPAGGMLIVLGGANSGGRGFLVDIAVGAAASEQVIIPNLYHYAQQDSTFTYTYVPISVPKGSRLSARVQSTSASSNVRVNLILVAGESSLPQAAVDYGSNTGSTTGTSVTSGSGSNNKGSWAQLTASTTAPHRWGIFCVRASGNSQYLFDIGIGGSGSEQVLVPNLNCRDSSTGPPVIYSMPMRIPKGTRVACRAASATGSLGASVVLVMI